MADRQLTSVSLCSWWLTLWAVRLVVFACVYIQLILFSALVQIHIYSSG